MSARHLQAPNISTSLSRIDGPIVQGSSLAAVLARQRDLKIRCRSQEADQLQAAPLETRQRQWQNRQLPPKHYRLSTAVGSCFENADNLPGPDVFNAVGSFQGFDWDLPEPPGLVTIEFLAAHHDTARNGS